jgi:hypothetical protein
MDMKKFLTLSFLSMFVASQANAGFISVITGADMAGIQVTATFTDTSTEVLDWAALTADSGGVTGTGWSLTQEGDTFGELDNINQLLVGEWTLTNNSPNLESLFIDLLSGFVFDTDFGDASANGSGPGRELVSDISMNFSFGGFVQDELYSTLMLTNFVDGQTLFMTDTDAVVVSAPTTFSLLMLSLFGLMINSRRKQAQGDINV